MSDWKFNLGDRVRDPISKVVGIVFGRSEWLYNCRTITVAPEGVKDGKPIEHQFFDEDRLVLVKRNVHEQPPLYRIAAESGLRAPKRVYTGGPDRPTSAGTRRSR